MARTPNGRHRICFTWLPALVISLVAGAISCLPVVARRWLLRKYLGQAKNPDMVEGLAHLVSLSKVQNYLRMAHSEMEEVRALDQELVAGTRDKCFYYFGQSDRWCPLSFAQEIIRKVPGLRY